MPKIKTAIPSIDIESPSIINVSKEHAADFTVGEETSMSLVGVVKGVRDLGDGKFQIELAQAKVSSVEGNRADREINRIRIENSGTDKKERVMESY